MVEITERPIDTARAHAALQDGSCGGVSVFEGRVRNRNGGRPVTALYYECYRPMARKVLEAVRAEALRRFPVAKAVIVHRVGDIPLGEAAVWVGAAGAHRDGAFDACRFMIDELKREVPIWKKETYADGTREWAHCSHSH
jgi:molybdopterin synthase catalytic subunit